MSVSVRKAVQHLNQVFLGINGIKAGDEVGYGEDSIFLGDCAEGGTINMKPACDYYACESDPHEKIWQMGVHIDLVHELKELGYFAECIDPGTYVAYQM